MSTKRTNFFDGFQSETTPDTVIVSASGIIGEWKGAWTSTDYVLNDAVFFEGSGYICILDTTAAQDPSDGTYWDLVSQKGEEFRVDDFGDLDEAKVSAIQALPGITGLNRHYFLVEDDTRSNQALPAEISGDKSRHIVIWDGTVFADYGEYTGEAGVIGPQGPQGDPGEDAAGIAVREVPTGLVNNSNTVYTLSNTPTSDAHLSFYVDGNFLEDSEYSLLGNQVTLNLAPNFAQTVFASYSHSGTPVSAPGSENIIYHTVTAGEETAKQFTLPSTPTTASLTLVDIIGGTSQEFSVDFTVSGTTFDWSGLGLDGDLVENDIVRVKYFN